MVPIWGLLEAGEPGERRAEGSTRRWAALRLAHKR